MAKKEEKPKTVLERVYIVPLRKEFQKVASWRRTEKAVKALREFIAKHMKSENVIIGKLIPAGTGMSRYKDISISTVIE